MQRSEGLLGYLLLALAVALTNWLYLSATRPGSPADQPGADTPDAFADNIIVSSLNVDGTLTQRLWAEHSEHFPGEGDTTLTAPYVEVYKPDGPPWRIRARHGWISGDGKEIHLSGEVQMLRAAGPNNKSSAAYTEEIRFWPERDYAETPRRIRYETKGFEMTALGMRAWIDESRVELLNRVHAIQQPKKDR